MNKLFAICAVILMTASVFLPKPATAQAPEKMSYQAVVRNNSDQLVKNTQIKMRISIQKYVIGIPPSYQNVYIETHSPTTNMNGQVSLIIGDGNVAEGVFSDIDWSDGEYYIKTETDPSGGTNYTISGTTQLLSVPYALYTKNVKTYKVGDFAHGGVVFWVDETGQHGLVCAVSDQSAGVRWYAGTFGNTQAKGDGPFAGKANTSIIIASHVAIGDDGTTYAARICNELLVIGRDNDKTYGDWYLPSKEELNLMYVNRFAINSTATAHGGSSFANVYYWSSTERNINFAWKQTFVDGSQNYDALKYNSYSVRAIRSF